MRQVRREEEIGGFGVTMPVFLGIWLVCALLAGISWSNLVSNTLSVGKLGMTPIALIVLSVSFGLPGAGLVCMAWDIIRRP